VLTRGCLGRLPVERSGEPGTPAAERFDEVAIRLLLDPKTDPAAFSSPVYANAAYKRHLAARGNAQRIQLEADADVVQDRLARQARSWGVQLSV
jgi:hypothetical protein